MSSDDSHIETYNLRAVRAQARLIELVVPVAEQQVNELVDNDSFFDGIGHIYMVGCGDSLFAAVSARMSFEKFTGIPTEAMDALEFSRYTVDYIPENSLVIGISKSGRVPRTLEGVDLAKQRGIRTLGLTEYDTGLLAQLADKVLLQPMPDFGPGFEEYDAEHHIGLGNYVHSYLSLVMLAIKLGEKSGRLSKETANSLHKELLSAVDVVYKTSDNNIETALKLAAEQWRNETFFIVGAGPNLGTAMFSCAKIMEQPNLNGVFCMTEEWAHLQYFVTRPCTFPFIFLIPDGMSRDRALEQVRACKEMGGPTIVVCDENDKEAMEYADSVFKIYGKIREEFSPLAYIIPGELLATSLHIVRGRQPLIPPYDRQRMSEINSRQIRTGCRRTSL